MSKSENAKKRIKDEFDQIKEDSNDDVDFSKHLARPEELPDLGEIKLYDYDADLTVATEKSMDVLETLIDLYLGDVPRLKEHPYIANKMNEDAKVYAEGLFLTKMTRKNFLNQLKEVDNGNSSARMHEVINQTIGQIRENSKFLSSARSDLETFYKTLRKDLGYEEIVADNTKTPDEQEDEQEQGEIIDNRSLNDMIKNAMLNRSDEDDKKNKKRKKR